MIFALNFLISSLKTTKLIILIFFELEKIKLIKFILSLCFQDLRDFILFFIEDLTKNEIDLRLIFIFSRFKILVEDYFILYSNLFKSEYIYSELFLYI